MSSHRTGFGLIAVVLGMALLGAGCGGGGGYGGGVIGQGGGSGFSLVREGAVIGASSTASAELQELAVRLSAVLALGYNTTNADEVMRQLSGLNPSKPAANLFVVDTREPADFAKGHIPGAVNVPLQTLPQALLDGTSGIPSDKEVVVASYWGNDGNMASLLINIARVTDPAKPGSYPKSTTIFQGMTAWSFDRTLVPTATRFDDALGVVTVQKATEVTTHPGLDQSLFPVLAAFEPVTDTVAKRILVRAREFFRSVSSQFELHLYPKTLAAHLEDGSAANDPQLLSVRSAADYKAAHVPGAINIPYQSVAKLTEYTKYLNPGKPIAVYCYTGHTGALATMALGILGYEPRNILYGINGWSTTAKSSGQLSNFDVNRGWDFPLHNTGDGIETLAAYTPPSTGCQGCHTSLTAIWTDLVKSPLASVPAPPSSGEG